MLILFQNTISGKGGGIEKYGYSIRNLFNGSNEISIVVSPLYPYKVPIIRAVYHNLELRNLINEVNPDIIHINGNTSFAVVQGILIAKRLKKKVVLTPHWHPFKYMRRPFFAKLFFFSLIKPCLRYVDSIITINNEEFKFYSKLHSNVVQFPHWYQHENEKTFSDQRIEKSANTILFVGRLNETNKGIEHIYHLPEGKYNIICVGHGEIPYRRDIQIFQSMTEKELNHLYDTASLVVVPSRYEAFSYVALEALSHGTPVVISERVRIADYLEDKKGIGIFTFHDYIDFNSKVESLIHTKINIVDIMTPFSPETAKCNYKRLYKSLVTS